MTIIRRMILVELLTSDKQTKLYQRASRLLRL